MGGIGVITNPKARRNLKRPWMRQLLEKIVGDAGKVYETRSIDELPDVARDFIARGLDILAVNGGDGTTHIALTHFIPIYGDMPLPKLLSLRGGTMNTISKSIKHKGKSENILTSVVKKIRQGKPLDIIRQPLLKINEKYGFMWGYGIVGNFLEAYYKGTTLGPWQAVKVVSRIVASAIFRSQFAKDIFAVVPTKLTIDGAKFYLPQCRVVLSAAIKEMGLGAKLAYRAYEKLGYIHIRATEKPPSHIVPYTAHLFAGWAVPGVIDEVAREVIAETEGFPPYTVDGELYRDTNTFHLSQGPILQVIREGGAKIPKGIGIPADYKSPAIEEITSSKNTTSLDYNNVQHRVNDEKLISYSLF